ncbi:uncharacterized protein LOC125572131 isoform X1 [Nematostella vectensis]|uniref:uncharacterized protein LOC125572131 isoform X1 n=1 Tax=Nematostella vectensis TaxID=45351 RepID=UPI002077754C|nr:uncharacterized protein LOC125572131 isoform X1 [Nematostella vectensis]
MFPHQEKELEEINIGVMSEKPQTVFDTLTEVSRLLYSHPSKRCPRDILRLHNQSFLHAMTLKEVIKETKSLTDRKLYGRYFHSLVVHSPIQSRLVSGRSVNTEQQERHFNTFSAIAENTSSRRPGEIITPGLVRMQAELKLADQHRNTLSEQVSKINSIAKSSSALSNSIIPNRYILRHPNDCQAHLERISDFLLCGEGVWWRQVASGVEFFDGPQELGSRTAGPPLHHFRSQTIKSERSYLQECWDKCLTNDIPIPHYKVKIYDDDGDLKVSKLTGFFNDDDKEEEEEDRAEECEETEAHIISMQEEVNDDETEEEADMKGYDEDIVDLQPQDEEEVIEEKLDDLQTQCHINTGSHEAIHQSPPEQPVPHNQSVSQAQSSFTSKSTLANNVLKCIPSDSHAVRTLDKARTQLREHPFDKDIQRKYETTLAKIKTTVLSAHSQLKEEVMRWEKTFFLRKCTEPTSDDISEDPKISKVKQKLYLCRKLLKHWKITA